MKLRAKFLLVAFLGIAAAVGPVISRLRDLSDIRLATSPSSGQALVWNGTYWTNASAGTGDVTNTYNAITVTQYVRMPWITLTMSGSNMSTMDFSAASMFRLLATTNAFLGTPSNLPGTNVAQVVQLHFIQDSTGTRTLTTTNGSWEISGSGFSTNQVVPVNTNANALTIITFVTSPNSATKVEGVVAAIGQ